MHTASTVARSMMMKECLLLSVDLSTLEMLKNSQKMNWKIQITGMAARGSKRNMLKLLKISLIKDLNSCSLLSRIGF